MEQVSRWFHVLGKLSDGLASGCGVLFTVAAIVCAAMVITACFFVPRFGWRERRKLMFRRITAAVVLVLYLLAGILFTVFTRDPQAGHRMEILPFEWITDPAQSVWSALLHDLGSLILFLPAGILFSLLLYEAKSVVKTMMFCLGMSLLLEFLQYVGKTGIFSIEDILSQTIGGMLGALLVSAWSRNRGRKSAGAILLRAAFGVVLAAVFFSAAAFGTYHVLRIKGERGMHQNISSVSTEMESGDDGLVWYNGKAYEYNDQVITILCMGIDQRTPEIEEKDYVSGESGQADSIFLVVLDPVSHQLKVIAVSRDTMTEVPAFDYKGNYLGESVNHLGLAYAYGNGKDTSCRYMVDAVSRLFYGIPVNGYAAFNMETISALNDAVGGVTVTVPEEEGLSAANKKLIPGATVTLTGDMAETFVRYRDTEVHGSNNMRMARQKQFLLSFFAQAVSAVKKDVSLPVTLYQEFSREMVTDIGLDNAVYLITEAADLSFTENDLVILQGESREGSVYDEVYVDDQALYELILDTFYTEVSLK